MSNKVVTKNITLADGRTISIETGKLARQADGSVVVRMGDTMILATVVSNKEAREGVDFLPMSVDYQERFSAMGKIPGGFLKREARLSEYEILISRLVDRAIRPMFADDYHSEIQIALSLISGDEKNPPDALAALAASSALMVSDIPWNGPISEVRVARVNGEYKINPTMDEKASADLDLIVAATYDNITMVEGEMEEVSEEAMLEAMKVAHDAIKIQCQVQKELEAEVGATEKRDYDHEENDEELEKRIHDELYKPAYEVAKKLLADKKKRSELFEEIITGFIEKLESEAEKNETEVRYDLVSRYWKGVKKDASRNLALEDGNRLDGRAFDEIRPIWSEVDYLPGAHGSAVFTRGETQALTTMTLGTKLDEQMVDGAMISGYNKFMLHYNFPAFSTGEVRPNRGPGRREIGHGNLAYRALKNMLPPEEDSPYTIRIVSDILESNGSSSMATVCAGCLALMDGGIQIKRPVSGIAMGMISDSEKGKHVILSDILGDEDHLGDMDFKVTGTEKGITACQMDIKVDGLSYDVLKQALDQAKQGRLHILEEMKKSLEAPRADLKPHAPRSTMIMIKKELIGAVIGPGGKVIQEMQAETDTTINIEEVDNKGKVLVFATNADNMQAAVNRINAIVKEPEVGEVYDGTVKSIMPFGAFIEFMPGKEGLLHISEIKWERVEKMDGVMEEGEKVKVKLVEIDPKTGKFRLSRKVLLPKPERKDKPVANN